jgi:hypothetical protein
MRGVVCALVILHVLLPIATSAAEEKVSIQLNSVENTDNRCRLNFVIEYKSQVGIESMKLDLVAFGGDGGILSRVIVEMGPVRPAKTMVRAFAVGAECAHISALLVNDVVACTPSEPGACLDGLVLSSRIQALRFYK